MSKFRKVIYLISEATLVFAIVSAFRTIHEYIRFRKCMNEIYDMDIKDASKNLSEAVNARNI